VKNDLKTDIIAIDGPAGSGKSTTAKLVAKQLGFTYLDTGAMYRALTLKALRQRLNFHDETALKALIKNIDIQVLEKNGRWSVIVDGENVTKKIRTEQVTEHVATIASQPAVRTWMVQWQRKLGKQGKIVAEGRDIGTVVFPEARLKIFLVASLAARAKRRAREFSAAEGDTANLEKIAQKIKDRDQKDSQREVSPLIKADEAIEIDTTDLTIEQQVDLIVKEWHAIADRQE